ncbi:MAG: hypothetical protein A2Y79_02305 [Deltaproteobacteria bacterium RBG_13_43_22]|nr:MAG: hypothetical protein A2Y79_02305 [Deltaproteobacteria bacterium RBG_13_43_22]
MKNTSFSLIVMFLFLLCSLNNAQGGFMDIFSGLTGRTSNDAKVSADNYSPDVAKSLSRLKGKLIHLASFTNNAENTKQFSYPSAEGKFFYVVGHGSVESYFWYCFKKGLLSSDMKVLEESPTEPVPSLMIKLQFLTDKQFKAEVVVTRGKNFFKKKIEENFELSKTDDREELAFNAYKFMDIIIVAVMTDPEVVKALGY